jgi:predicted nucleic acid-binding protein
VIVYLDASALVKRYVEEAGSGEVRALIKEAEAVATAAISRTEVVAALARARRAKRIGAQEAGDALKAFEADWEDVVRVQITEPLLAQAASLAWSYSLRGYDAVHLAAGLFWRERVARPTLLASYDRELWEAARRAGLEVWPEIGR